MLDKQSEVRVSRKTSYYLKVGNQPELRRVMARQPSVGGLPLTFVSGFSLGYKLYHILLFLFIFFLFFFPLYRCCPSSMRFLFLFSLRMGSSVLLGCSS